MEAYQWTDPQTDETVEDGCSLLNKVLKLMRSDVQANIYVELAKFKSIKPVNYTFNMIKWHLAIESKRISIEQRLSVSYHKLQFIMDYLDASLTVEVTRFTTKISIIQTNTSVAIQTNGPLHTSVVKSSTHIIICLRMGSGNARSEKRIKSLLSQQKLPYYKQSLIASCCFCYSSQINDQPFF
jgi:hypothetical protein